MPRPMLKMPQAQTVSSSRLSAVCNQENKQRVTEKERMKMNRLLEKNRSKAYMDALCKLDAGGHIHNQAQVDEILAAIKNEFPEVDFSGILLGFVSKCYLGKPYEVHSLNLAGGIIEHYKEGEALPGGMEKARGIAIYGGYELIEVYTDCCRAVSAGGEVSVIYC